MVNDKVYCGQCGGANPASNKFCGKCGAILDKLQDLQEKTSSTLPPIPSPHPNACPKCKNIDQIQKLSTIVSAGTRNTSGVSATTGETNLAGDQRHYARGTGYVGSSELSGKAYSTSSTFIDATEKTDLAKRLSPPRKPQEPVLKRHGFAEWMISTGGVVAVVAGIVGAAMLAEPWGIIGGIVGFIGGIVGAFFLGVGFDSLVFGSSRKISEGIFRHGSEPW